LVLPEGEGVAVMHPALQLIFAKPAAQSALAVNWAQRVLLCALLAAMALPAGSALAQDNPFMPKLSLQGDQKRKLTPEEEERQQRLDADYKAATKKIPDQKAADPWADVRQAPAAPAPKTTASAQKKKTQPQAQ
jgi:hypothetical protein